MRIPQTTRGGVRWPRQTVGDFPGLNAQHIALTIDDGPTQHTEEILAALDSAGVPATFFVIGKLVLARADLITKILERGHSVGIHGWTHTHFSRLTAPELRLELTRTLRTLPSPPTIVRPPYGDLDAPSLDLLHDLGLEAVGWSVHCEDWVQDRTRTEMATEMIRDTTPGDILLLHDREHAGQLIQSVVAGLAARGLTWTALPWQ